MSFGENLGKRLSFVERERGRQGKGRRSGVFELSKHYDATVKLSPIRDMVPSSPRRGSAPREASRA